MVFLFVSLPFVFSFNATATTEIYTLSLHDALPIFGRIPWFQMLWRPVAATIAMLTVLIVGWPIQPFIALVLASLTRSEEHTSELQSLRHLVCRLLLEKKNAKYTVQRHQTNVYSLYL